MSSTDSDPSREARHERLAAKLEALDEFYKTLGKAVAAWSAVEDGLFEWFMQCSGMHLQLARAVYYSARSFEGRRDMLIAAIPFSPCDEKTRTGIRLCLKRAGQYLEFRNRLSHGHHLYVEKSKEHVFAEGRTLSNHQLSYVATGDLRIAADNFGRLTDCILGFHPLWQSQDVCDQGCLEEIQALPIAANSIEPSQTRPQK